ncbi:MAG TPA: response regulator transcription factor [Streptosporangiaceae bacterium]|nr:response regulator transcription factor [Streptosporangiaceae bacterium]
MGGLIGPDLPVRVVLAEDNVLLREGVAGLLERAGFEIVGQAGDADGLIALVRTHSPDLVVVDIRMPPGHSTEGLDAALTIRKEFPEIGIVLLSAFVHAEHAVGLLSSGRRIGYLLKDRVEDVTEFVQSLRRVADGGVVIDPDLVQDLVRARHGDDPLGVLSAREREVLALMAEGRSNAGIARRIWISEATVEKHVHSILGKLNLPDSTEGHRRVLAVLAYLSSTRS